MFLRPSKWIRINKIQTNDDWPSTRGGHTLNYYNNHLYLYGGCGGGYKSDFYQYSIESNIWKGINDNGFETPDCHSHRTVTYNNYLILFGGLTKVTIPGSDKRVLKCYNGIYLFNLDTHKWSIINCISKPSERRKHGMCIVNRKLIIHGGINTQNEPLNDMFMMDMDDLISNNSPKWIKYENSITQMGNLYAHSLLSHNQTILFFGGNASVKTAINERGLNTLNLFTNHTKQITSSYITTNTSIPFPNVLSDIILKYIEPIWTQKSHSLPTINPRYQHNSCLIPHKNNTIYLFIFGGSPYNADGFLIHIQI